MKDHVESVTAFKKGLAISYLGPLEQFHFLQPSQLSFVVYSQHLCYIVL